MNFDFLCSIKCTEYYHVHDSDDHESVEHPL